MMPNQKKVITIVLLVFLPILVYLLVGAWIKRTAIFQQWRSLQQEYQQLVAENEQMGKVIADIQFDVVREMEVRKKLNYTKPGEVLVLFVSPSPAFSPTFDVSPVQDVQDGNFLQKIKRFFKKER